MLSLQVVLMLFVCSIVCLSAVFAAMYFPIGLLLYGLPICFLLALSQMAGRRCTFRPDSSMQSIEQTRTPRQDFFSIRALWLLVLRMAQPLTCLLASSLSAWYTLRLCPVGHSSKGSCVSGCNKQSRSTIKWLLWLCLWLYLVI